MGFAQQLEDEPSTALRAERGHGLMAPEPKADGSEFNHGEEVGRVFLVARGNVAAMLNLVEEPLEVVAF
jgi:hypothetical protein